MNAEQISDALNFLDEDLIAQTDEVRRGARVMYQPPLRKIIPAAACAALVIVGVLSIPPAVEKSDAVLDNMMEMSNAGGSVTPEYGLEPSAGQWQMATNGTLTVYIPPDWEWSEEDVNGQWESHLALFHGENHLVIGYYPTFAVCGTGLKEDAITIAGMEAQMGTYDDNTMWDFICFPGDYVAINYSGENWTEEEQDAILSILETLTFEKEETK